MGRHDEDADAGVSERAGQAGDDADRREVDGPRDAERATAAGAPDSRRHGSSSHTIDSSSGVRATQVNTPRGQRGMAASAASLQIASRSGRSRNVKE